MSPDHKCIVTFETRPIDHCSGVGFDICFGTSPMILEVWFQDKNGLEDYEDGWATREVNFCPFCGLKSQSKTSKQI